MAGRGGTPRFLTPAAPTRFNVTLYGTTYHGSPKTGPSVIQRVPVFFNGRFRDDCLNQHWFTTLADARLTIEAWRVDYNDHRPHSALGQLTPREFAAAALGQQQGGPATPDRQDETVRLTRSLDQ